MTPVPVNPTCAGARRLIALSDAYMSELYPADSNHFETPEALGQPHVRFVGIHAEGELVACGGVKLMDDDGVYGEVKRVFVLPAHRGGGLARIIMAALEFQLMREGYALARLETGVAQRRRWGCIAHWVISSARLLAAIVPIRYPYSWRSACRVERCRNGRVPFVVGA